MKSEDGFAAKAATERDWTTPEGLASLELAIREQIDFPISYTQMATSAMPQLIDALRARDAELAKAHAEIERLWQAAAGNDFYQSVIQLEAELAALKKRIEDAGTWPKDTLMGWHDCVEYILRDPPAEGAP